MFTEFMILPDGEHIFILLYRMKRQNLPCCRGFKFQGTVFGDWPWLLGGGGGGTDSMVGGGGTPEIKKYL